MKRTLSELAEELERAKESEWEAIYTGAEVEANIEEWETLIRSEKPFSDWLAFRFEAGLPGVPLPEPAAALRRLLEGPTRSPADAYAVIFKRPAITEEVVEEAGPEFVFAMLFNAALAVLKGRGQWLGWWIGARAGLAAIALGRPDLAWQVLDLAGHSREQPLQLDKLALFATLRSEPALARSPWIRLALWRLWPGFNLPVLPSLPKLAFEDDDPDEQLEDVIERLERAGATGVAGLVRGLRDSLPAEYPAELEDHPIIRALVGLAVEGQTEPLPQVQILPEGFAEWARAQGKKGAFRLTHLAGRLLLRHGWADKEFVAVLLLPAVTLEDLPALATMFERSQKGLRLHAELVAAASALPTALANAFIAAYFPKHIANRAGLGVLVANADVFADAIHGHPSFSGFSQAIRTEAANARRFDQAAMQPEVTERLTQLTTQAATAASRLPAAHAITPEQLEAVASRVNVGELSEALLGRLAKPVEAPLPLLVLSLAVSHALRGTDGEAKWRPLFDQMVCRAVGALEAKRLMPWRNQMLDRLIRERDPRLSLAHLYHMRSNGHLAHDNLAEAARDLLAAKAEAAREGDDKLLLDASNGLNRLANRPAFSPKKTSQPSVPLDPTVLAAQDPATRAHVLQTEARGFRTESPQDAFDRLEEAISLIEPGTRLHAELAAEAVAVLEYLGRDCDGIRLGRFALHAAVKLEPCFEVAMLQLETGAALDRKRYCEEGLGLMRLGLDGLRGHDIRNEAVARLKLLWARGFIPGEEIAEHERWLRDHFADFDATLRRDVEHWATNQKSRRVTAGPDAPERDARDSVVRHVVASGATPPGGLWVPPEGPALPDAAWTDMVDSLAEVERSRAALREAMASLAAPEPGAGAARAMKAAESAWHRARAAAPFLIATGVAMEDLSQAAMASAGWFAGGFGEARASGAQGLGGVWLQGTDARSVVTWLARSGIALQRPLEARFGRPAAVPYELWMRWKHALDNGPAAAVSALRDIRRFAPEFLANDADAGAVWRFLATEPGAVCVAPFVTGDRLLVALLALGPTGEKVEAVLVANAQTSEFADDVDWLRSRVRAVVERRLGARPSLVLWVPGPTLRNVNPSRVWGEVPVACALGLSTSGVASRRFRPRSTLVALADPGMSATVESPALGPSGRAAFDAVVAAAAPFGAVRRMASIGPSFGRTVLGNEAVVRDTPVSASDLLAEAPNHDLIVIIAHGHCERPGSAAFVCVDSVGHLQTLDVARLANESESFAGANIVLLSCDSGRVGSGLQSPGGLAGVLLAAGANCVIAPLQPLRVRAAEEVGATIVEKLCRGATPWEILKSLQGQAASSGGTDLGRPARSAAEQLASRPEDVTAFVSWVG